MLVRDGLLVGIPKHGVSWKGDYIDEGLFAGPKRVEGTVSSLKLKFLTSRSEDESQSLDG